MTRIKTYLVFIFIFSETLIFAQEPSDVAGTASFTFLRMGLSSRVAALGESFVAIADDENALYYNPAGLAALKYGSFALNHTNWFQDINMDNLTMSWNISDSYGIGFGISHMWMPAIEGRDQFGEPTSDFNVSSSVATVGFAFRVYEEIRFGFSAKYLIETLADYEASGMAFDLGFLSNTFIPGLHWGASIQNLGSKLKFHQANQDLPLTYRVGSAYKFGNSGLILSGDLVKSIDSNVKYSFGVEYEYEQFVSLRFGNKAEDLSEFAPSFGAGLRVQDNFSIDYSFYSNYDLGGTHRFGLAYDFNMTDLKRRKPVRQTPGKLKYNELLAAPRNVKILENGTKLKLVWDPLKNVQYNVYAMFSSNNQWVKITKTPISENYFECKRPTVKGTYIFRITTVLNQYESQYSEIVDWKIE